MKENLVYVKLGLLLIIAPIVIWTGALRATARSYREYRQLGKALDKALNHEATIDLSVVSDRDQLSSGEAIAGISSVSSYIPKVERSESGLTWVSARVEIKGGYHELLRALNTLEEKVRRSGTTDTELNLAIERVRLCEAIHKIFEDGVSAYRDKLKKSVEEDATKLFRGISSDPDYVALQINDKYGLSIVHKDGDLIPLRSSGFEHVVALSLIGALHKNAPLSGPIIMDSPFGRLDPTHKRNITKSLPQMSDEVILLAYTDEIDAELARSLLGSNLKKEYRLRKYGSFHTEIESQ